MDSIVDLAMICHTGYGTNQLCEPLLKVLRGEIKILLKPKPSYYCCRLINKQAPSAGLCDQVGKLRPPLLHLLFENDLNLSRSARDHFTNHGVASTHESAPIHAQWTFNQFYLEGHQHSSPQTARWLTALVDDHLQNSGSTQPCNI